MFFWGSRALGFSLCLRFCYVFVVWESRCRIVEWIARADYSKGLCVFVRVYACGWFSLEC